MVVIVIMIAIVVIASVALDVDIDVPVDIHIAVPVYIPVDIPVALNVSGIDIRPIWSILVNTGPGSAFRLSGVRLEGNTPGGEKKE